MNKHAMKGAAEMNTKTIVKTLVTGLSMLALTACGDVGRPKEVGGAAEGEKIMSESGSKTLVVYFTRSGRTRQVAHWIQGAAQADLIELKTVIPYPSGYKNVVEQAKKEIRDGVKPALKTKLDNFAGYDTIFVGTPNWWSTMAPPVATFLASYDFTGKTVIPFVTHGGGGEARCVSDMKKLCPKANFKSSLVLRDSRVPDAQAETAAWAKSQLGSPAGVKK